MSQTVPFPLFTPAEKRIFARRERISVSAWAAQHLVVPDGPHAGGRFRRDVNVYLLDIMDTWGRPEVEEVVTCGSAQTGKTLCLYACLCYAIDMRDGPRMLAMPDDDTMERVVAAKLRPMFRRTRPVAQLLRKIRNGRVDFTNGTNLYLASAASPSQRASVSIMDLFLDEEALFRQFQGQGLPVLDFLERTRSYEYKRKIMRISKPVGGEECTIVTAMQDMDEVRRFYAACPACGTLQLFDDANVIVEGGVGDPVLVVRERLGRYLCPHCRYHWTDILRDRAVSSGCWQADTPVHRPRKIGYILPSILASVVSLSEIAAAKLKKDASDDPELHQAYANGYWAEPYKPVVVSTREDTVLTLRDPELAPRTVPQGSVALTCGIDMQKRGFYFMVCAWTPRLDCTVIDYGRLAEWNDVHSLLFATSFPCEGTTGVAGTPPTPEADTVIWRAALDTGGGETDSGLITRGEEAYQFVTRYGQGVLHATKGNAHKQINPVMWSVRERMPKSKALISGGLRLFLLDTDYFKSLASARLSPEARQPLRLHSDCDEDLAKQLTAEELIRERGGKRRWRRKHKDNHYWDCLCMNFACVHPTWMPSLSRLTAHLLQADLAEQANPALPVATPSPPADHRVTPRASAPAGPHRQNKSAASKRGSSLW